MKTIYRKTFSICLFLAVLLMIAGTAVAYDDSVADENSVASDDSVADENSVASVDSVADVNLNPHTPFVSVTFTNVTFTNVNRSN